MVRRTRKKRSGSTSKAKKPKTSSDLELKTISLLDWTIRQQALDVLRNHQETQLELPVMYAALKTVQEIGMNVQVEDGTEHATKESTDPPSESSLAQPQLSSKMIISEEQCLTDALLAIPYLMYKKAKDTLLLPRTMGGLAYSDAKAKEVAHDVFAKLGPKCCFVNEDELQNHLSAQDAHKLLPFLQQVGREARCQVDELQAHWKESAEAQLLAGTTKSDKTTTTITAEEHDKKEHQDSEPLSETTP